MFGTARMRDSNSVATLVMHMRRCDSSVASHRLSLIIDE